MKSTKVGFFDILFEGEGDIPVLVLGPPQVFIPTISDELKKYCVFYGVDYPFKIDGKQPIPKKYQLSNWDSIQKVCQFYHDVGYGFAKTLDKDKFIVIGPSMMGVVADYMSNLYPENIHAACLLSPAQTTLKLNLEIETSTTFGSAIKNGCEISDFHFYLDALHEEADKDFNDIDFFRPVWLELWKKGTDNINTQTRLISLLAGLEIGGSQLPTLIIAGEKDGRFPVEIVKSFRLPLNYKRVILPGGHATHFEYHFEFSDVFVGWLEEMQIKRPEPKIADRTIALRQTNSELQEEIKIRKIIESELRTSRTRYKNLTAIAPVGIFRINEKGQFLDKNEVFSSLTGLFNQLIFLNCFLSAITSSNANEIQLAIHSLTPTSGVLKFECQFGCDDQRRWVICHLIKEESSGDLNYIGTLTDLTKKKLAEELAYRHQNELAHYSRINTLAEMVTGISHELSQPLSSVSQYVFSLKNELHKIDKLSVVCKELIHKIEMQTERAGTILHKIKNFIIRKEVQKKSICIYDLIFDVKDLLSFDLLENNIYFDISIKDRSIFINVDSIQIQQVILNIVKNAVEAMIDATCKKQIFIKVEKEDHYVNIFIQDNGPGIDVDKLQSIFDPFYTTKSTGTGMGLAISATIVNAHSGTISVKSTVGVHTVFTIQLPLCHELTDREVEEVYA